MSILKASYRFASLCLRYKYTLSSRIPLSVGYQDYKFHYIKTFINNGGLTYFTNKQLPDNYGYRLDERVVEYPWFLSSLKDEEKIILDAGSVLNFTHILSTEKLQNRSLYLSTLSYEGRADTFPSPSYIYEDLRNMCFKDNFFDAICCLSTLEHIGLDNTRFYTPDPAKRESDVYSYLTAVREFKRVLKTGGTLYLSVPFGEYKNYGWLQIFTSKMINNLIETFAPEKCTKIFFHYEKNQWNFSSEDFCQDGDYFDIHNSGQYMYDFLAAARSIACISLTK